MLNEILRNIENQHTLQLTKRSKMFKYCLQVLIEMQVFFKQLNLANNVHLATIIHHCQ